MRDSSRLDPSNVMARTSTARRSTAAAAGGADGDVDMSTDASVLAAGSEEASAEAGSSSKTSRKRISTTKAAKKKEEDAPVESASSSKKSSSKRDRNDVSGILADCFFFFCCPARSASGQTEGMPCDSRTGLSRKPVDRESCGGLERVLFLLLLLEWLVVVESLSLHSAHAGFMRRIAGGLISQGQESQNRGSGGRLPGNRRRN